MTVQTRTQLAMQAPAQYERADFARLLRMIDQEFTRLTQFAGTVTWNPGNIANGASDTVSVTVPGADVNVLASVRVFAPYTLSGLQASGYVSANDTVTITLYNNTGGAVNLGSGVWGVVVENFVLT